MKDTSSFAEPTKAVQPDIALTQPHDLRVSKEMWVENNAAVVRDIGPRQYLQILTEQIENGPIRFSQGLSSEDVLAIIISPFYVVNVHPTHRDNISKSRRQWIEENEASLAGAPQYWLMQMLAKLETAV